MSSELRLKERDRSEVYDKLYDLAARLLRGANACANCPVKSPPRKLGDLLWRERSKTWCCGGCRHTSDTGCTVKALGCKLWLCGNADSGWTLRLGRRLDKLVRIATHYNVYVARASKEESLKHGFGDPWALYPNNPKVIPSVLIGGN